MTTKTLAKQASQKLELLPADKIMEVMNFADYLIAKTMKRLKPLVLETDIDKAIEQGLQSKMLDEKEFKKQTAQWKKHYSE